MWLLTGKGEMKRATIPFDATPAHLELLQLCKSLVANYQQRDQVMGQLVSMVNNLDINK